MEIIKWILIGLAVFMILDSLLSIAFGSYYILWGLEYTPAAYRSLIERISKLQPVILWRIRLTELAMGILFLWLGLMLKS